MADEPPDPAEERRLREAIADGDDYAWVELGLHLASAGRDGEAEDACREAIAAGYGAWRFLGSLLAKRPGRDEEAEDAYREAIADGDTAAWANLGWLLARRPGGGRAALAAHREAIACGHAELGAPGALHVGLTFDSEGDLDTARAAYELAIGHGDEATVESAGTNLGYLLAYLGDRAGSSAAFEAATYPLARRVSEDATADIDEREEITEFATPRLPRLFARLAGGGLTRRAVRRNRLWHLRRYRHLKESA